MLGEKERPMAMAEVHAKFAELSPNLDEGTRAAVCDVVDDLENRSVDDLLMPLRR
jgi:hypothetical protein